MARRSGSIFSGRSFAMASVARANRRPFSKEIECSCSDVQTHHEKVGHEDK